MKICSVILVYPPGYYAPTTTEAPNYGYDTAYGYVAQLPQSCGENEVLNAKNECVQTVQFYTPPTVEVDLCALFRYNCK